MAVTVVDVKTQLAADFRLAGGSADLIASWDTTATHALAQAQSEINAILASRGLSAAQIATWAGLDPFTLKQAVFWALTHGAAMLPAPVNEDRIKALDGREWLATAVLVDATGAILVPAPPIIGHGNVSGGWADVSSKDPERPLGPFVDRGGRMRRW